LLKSGRMLWPDGPCEARIILYGGLLFVPLSCDYLLTWGSEWWQEAPSEIVSICENETCSASRSELVLLQEVLADRVNQGYPDFEALIIDRVQRRKIRHLKQLIRIFESAMGEFVRLEVASLHSILLHLRLPKNII